MQDNFSRCTSSMPCSIFVLGLLSLCSFLLCCFSSVERSVKFDSMFSFLFCYLIVGPFMGHFENTVVPYWQSLKLHFKNTMVPHQLPLRLTLAMRLLRNTHVFFFQIFHNAISLFKRYECIYGTRYEYILTYIHIYIHRDIACVQHVNVGLVQARPNNRMTLACIAIVPSVRLLTILWQYGLLIHAAIDGSRFSQHH